MRARLHRRHHVRRSRRALLEIAIRCCACRRPRRRDQRAVDTHRRGCAAAILVVVESSANRRATRAGSREGRRVKDEGGPLLCSDSSCACGSLLGELLLQPVSRIPVLPPARGCTRRRPKRQDVHYSNLWCGDGSACAPTRFRNGILAVRVVQGTQRWVDCVTKRLSHARQRCRHQLSVVRPSSR